ncbi:MAG TPA: hypothetical protein VN841_08105 [Bryobacteraceae bacterium]|nr:hypothetical protein [Bryobacteraceae bacterium]
MRKRPILVLSLGITGAIFGQDAATQPQHSSAPKPIPFSFPNPFQSAPLPAAPHIARQAPPTFPPFGLMTPKPVFPPRPYTLNLPAARGAAKLCSVPLLQMTLPKDVHPVIGEFHPQLEVEPMPQAKVPAPPCAPPAK